MGLKQFLTPKLVAWAVPSQCSQAPQAVPPISAQPGTPRQAPHRKAPTLSRELSTTNWSPKSILPAARPLPTT